MKARIKKTGELVYIASYAKITLESCDSWGNPIELSPEDVELINNTPSQDRWQEPCKLNPEKDLSNPIDHWQDVRERAAIAAIQGFIAHGFDDSECMVKRSIRVADALVKKLKGE